VSKPKFGAALHVLFKNEEKKGFYTVQLKVVRILNIDAEKLADKSRHE